VRALINLRLFYLIQLKKKIKLSRNCFLRKVREDRLSHFIFDYEKMALSEMNVELMEPVVAKDRNFFSRFIEIESNFPKTARDETWVCYRLSSFTFTVAGFLLLFWPENCHESNVATVFGCLLVFQGPISYLNDQHTLGHASIWRIIDRVYATALTLFCICYAIMFTREAELDCAVRIDQHLIWWPGLVLGLIFFKCSTSAATAKDLKTFQFYHILWHLSLPLAGSYIILT